MDQCARSVASQTKESAVNGVVLLYRLKDDKDEDEFDSIGFYA